MEFKSLIPEIKIDEQNMDMPNTFSGLLAESNEMLASLEDFKKQSFEIKKGYAEILSETDKLANILAETDTLLKSMLELTLLAK
jgi:hypothetical protein